MTRFAWLLKLSLAVAGAGMAQGALADVKQGVDAWQRGDYSAAVNQWRPLAIGGDADAQFNLAQAYKLGRGVPTDLAQAEQWYRRAAEQGHPQAEDNYGLVLFQNGKRAEALPWLEKSVARGEPRAEYILGTALFNGDLVTKDWTRAYALMTRASAAGLPQASQTLAQMDQLIPLDQRQKSVVLARALESERARPIVSVAQPVPAPATPKAKTPGAPYPIPGSAPATAKPAPKAIEPAKSAVKLAEATKTKPAAGATPVKAAPAVTAKPLAGGWRIQLGAFSDQARAKALWGLLRSRFKSLGSAQPHFVNAGAVTRLQVGSFAKADAERQCTTLKAAGQPCMAIKP